MKRHIMMAVEAVAGTMAAYVRLLRLGETK